MQDNVDAHGNDHAKYVSFAFFSPLNSFFLGLIWISGVTPFPFGSAEVCEKV